MIQILFSWCLVLPTLILIGGTLIGVFEKKWKKVKQVELDVLIVLGFVAVTVYAQVFSLFQGVGLAANIILWAVDILVCVWKRNSITAYLAAIKKKISEYPCSKFIIFAIIVFAFAIADASAGENVCFDTNLYHAQSIRWIEEVGVAKGSSLLLYRLGYNSSFFSLQALFSFKFLFGQSLRNINGLVAFVFLTYDILSFRSLWRGRFAFSDALRIVSMLIVFDVTDYKSSSTDMFTMLLGLYILTKWCSYIEDGDYNTHGFAMLCMMAVFATTLKLSAAGLLVLTIFPITKLWKRKEFSYIGCYALAGLLIALPFFVRNYEISGWLVYPFSKVDLFQVDWKVAKDVVDNDAESISAWAKEIALRDDVTELTGMKWFPFWLSSKTLLQKSIVFVDLMMVPVGIVVAFIIGIIKKKEGVIALVLSINTVFLMWFFKAPLIRYGNGWFYLNTAVLIGGFFLLISKRIIDNRKWSYVMRILAACAILFCIQHNFGPIYHHENLLRQVDYEMLDCNAVTIDGQTVYCPGETNLPGYHYFPVGDSEWSINQLQLRGKDIKEGFTYKKE